MRQCQIRVRFESNQSINIYFWIIHIHVIVYVVVRSQWTIHGQSYASLFSWRTKHFIGTDWWENSSQVGRNTNIDLQQMLFSHIDHIYQAWTAIFPSSLQAWFVKIYWNIFLSDCCLTLLNLFLVTCLLLKVNKAKNQQSWRPKVVVGEQITQIQHQNSKK